MWPKQFSLIRSRGALGPALASAGFCVMLAAFPLAAQTTTGDVRSAAQAFDNGNRQYQRRDFAGAATWFETADRLAPNAVAVQSAIRAHRDANTPDHLARAATLALRLRERYPNDTAALAFADRALRELAPQLGRLTVRCDQCEIEIDHTLQPGTDVFVAPGRHTLVAHWSGGRTWEQIFEVAANRSETLEVSPPAANEVPVVTPAAPREAAPVVPESQSPPQREQALPALPAAPQRRDEPQGGLHPAVFVTSAVVTALLGGGCIGTWLYAQAGGRELIEGAQRTHMPNPALEQDVQARENATTGLLIATGVAGAVTLTTLLFTRWGGAPRRIEVAPAVSTNGATGLTLRGYFF